MMLLWAVLCVIVGKANGKAQPQQLQQLPQPQPNTDVVTVIRQVDKKVDRLNSTITGKMQSIQGNVQNVETKVGYFDLINNHRWPTNLDFGQALLFS